MKKYILNFSIFISALIFSVIMINNADAQNRDASSDALSKLTYPIMELGGCNDRADCKIYCDDPANAAACVSYAEKKNLMSQEELRVAKNFVATGGKGPGDCNGKKECQDYCENMDHMDECVSYAEKNGLMSGQDLEKAKKVQAAVKKGVKFPGCKNKSECDVYCEETSHMEECIVFAKEAGLLTDEELQNTQKVLTAVKKGVKLPPCKGKEACDAYCSEASHTEECTNFAVAAGLVTSEEARIIKETGGKGPGGCKSKSECDSFCGNEANREICMNFAIEHNIPQPQPPQQPGQGGGPNEGEGYNPGTRQRGQQGQGTDYGQGGTGSGQGQSTNPNPVKCIEDCELNGNNCMGNAGDKTKACAAIGQNCRMVTCETYGAGGTRPTTQEEWNQCASYCRTLEDNCYAAISPTDGECRTTKDQCVTQCQKASKPTQPTQSGQPTQPTPPVPPTQPNQFPSPSQPFQPTPPPPPLQPGQSILPTQPTPPPPPTAGYCGDGKCGRMEQADPKLCPQDCGG